MTAQSEDKDSSGPEYVGSRGNPMENWLMKPALEWLEQAEHGADNERCKMIAALLRDLWRGPSNGTTTPLPELQPLSGETPRTDALLTKNAAHSQMCVDHARQLERELAEAKDVQIHQVEGPQGKPVAAPCQISGCQYEAVARSASGPILPPAVLYKAKDTLESQSETRIPLTVDFWRARAVYLAEEILRAPVSASGRPMTSGSPDTRTKA